MNGSGDATTQKLYSTRRVLFIYSFGEELKYRSRIATGISIFIFADQSAKLRCIETSSRRFVLVAHDQ